MATKIIVARFNFYLIGRLGYPLPYSLSFIGPDLPVLEPIFPLIRLVSIRIKISTSAITLTWAAVLFC